MVRLNSTCLPTSAHLRLAYSTDERSIGKFSRVSPPKNVTWIEGRSSDSLINMSMDASATDAGMNFGFPSVLLILSALYS